MPWSTIREISELASGTSSRSTSLPAKDYESRGELSRKAEGHFITKAPMGEWIACFKDLQHSEEMNAYDVFEGRQSPRPQSELCQQLTEELVTAEVYFDNVLEHQVEDENFPEKLRSYLQRVGHSMRFDGGIDAIEGFPAEEEVESEQEEIIEKGDPAKINLFDV
uniref:Uncharacterized protein n=1 Tax=Ditylenchus dipsaci TaxID=166011 RepID=A0A915CXU2_9BILA